MSSCARCYLTSWHPRQPDYPFLGDDGYVFLTWIGLDGWMDNWFHDYYDCLE